MKRKIVVIEDEADIRDILQYNLEREGFEVACAADGEAGLRAVRQQAPALVLLDLLLPGLDGLEVCRLLKSDPQTRNVPVIMVSAKGEESDVVLGLELGADDYAVKPFSPRELIARVRAVLRRADARISGTGDEPIVHGPLTVDPSRHQVTLDDRALSLTATEFRVLLCLARSPGRVFTREQLIRRAIGEDTSVVGRTIDVHIQSVRKKLGAQRELIETIRGVGYRFRADGLPSAHA